MCVNPLVFAFQEVCGFSKLMYVKWSAFPEDDEVVKIGADVRCALKFPAADAADVALNNSFCSVTIDGTSITVPAV